MAEAKQNKHKKKATTKNIYLVRHARATDRVAVVSDFDRPLIVAGVKKSRRAAKEFSKFFKTPDLMISSPAARAIETAHVFARHFDYEVQKIKIENALYEPKETSNIVDVIRKTDEQYKSVMLFGHDPSISEIASFICRDFSRAMPKSSVVCIDLGKASWNRIRKSSGKLKLFISPKRNKKKGHPVKE